MTENAKVIQHVFTTLFPKYYPRNKKYGIQNKSLVNLAYREWIFDTTLEKNKEKPQLAKDPNNYTRPEKNISEFEQVLIKENESSPLQNLACCYRKKLIIKILEQIKLRNKWIVNKKENEKTWKIEKRFSKKNLKQTQKK